jgi:cyanophycinase-like exopeptidase
MDFGALGIFAGFLIWQHLNMQKRMDKLIEDFQEEVRLISTAFDQRVELMKERYDKVIGSLKEENRKDREKWDSRKDDLQRQLLDRERESVYNIKVREEE